MKPECTISQGFGGNATDTYKAGGLLGHTGVDSDCGYGSQIHAIWGNEYVYKVLTKENPANDGSGFTGVFTIVDDGVNCFEFLYGHCNPLPNLIGTVLNKGQVLGTQANNGEVYSNGVRITLEMQRNGDIRGTHRHDQKRLLRKDTTIQVNTNYLTGLGGSIFFRNGFIYAIPDYRNGYNGCVDWTKVEDVLFKNMMFAIRDFQIGQGFLDFKGVTDPKKILIGPKTLDAIKKLQK